RNQPARPIDIGCCRARAAGPGVEVVANAVIAETAMRGVVRSGAFRAGAGLSFPDGIYCPRTGDRRAGVRGLPCPHGHARKKGGRDRRPELRLDRSAAEPDVAATAEL